jgi:hypothetical protein
MLDIPGAYSNITLPAGASVPPAGELASASPAGHVISATPGMAADFVLTRCPPKTSSAAASELVSPRQTLQQNLSSYLYVRVAIECAQGDRT